MKKTITIIILSVLVLGLAGYICYDKFYTKNEAKGEKEKNITITVEDGLVISKEESYGGLDGCKAIIDIKLPKVLVNGKESTTIKAILYNGLEEKILSQYEETKKNNIESKWCSEETISEYGNHKFSYTGSYDYVIKDDIVLLYTPSYYNHGQPHGGFGIPVEVLYTFYDAKNDRILSLKEGLEKFGYTADKFKALLTEQIKNDSNRDASEEVLEEELLQLETFGILDYINSNTPYSCGGHLVMENHAITGYEYNWQCE